MQHRGHVWLAVLVFGLLIGWSIPVAKADGKLDPSGTWKWERTFGDRTFTRTLKLAFKDGNLNGTYVGGGRSRDPVKLEQGKLDGDKLSFQVTREFNDRKFLVKYEGRLSEESIKGTLEFTFNDQSRSFDWEAKRATELADVLGTWNFKITTNNGRVIETSLKLAKDGEKLKGTYTARNRDIEAEQVTLKDNLLSFRVTREGDGRKFVATYKGKPIGDSIKGTVDYKIDDRSGSAGFEGKLVKQKKKDTN